MLKIDCEGCEWGVFESLLESGSRLPFDQLLVHSVLGRYWLTIGCKVELHLDNATDSGDIVQDKLFKLFEGALPTRFSQQLFCAVVLNSS